MEKKPLWHRVSPTNVLIVLLSAFAVIYLAVQTCNALASNAETVAAEYVTVDDAISASGWFVRNETVAEGTSSNTVKHIVSNGEKVQASAALAIVYADQSILEANRRLEEIEDELNLLNTAVQSVDSYTNDTTKTDQQISRQLEQLAGEVEDGMPTGAENTATELRKLLLRRNAASLDVSAIKSEIVALENEKNDLAGKAYGRSNTISAPASGYFSEVVDGYEQILTPDKVESMQPEAFKELTSQSVTEPQGKLGKVVDGFTWEFAVILSQNDAARLKVGQSVTLKFSQISANANAKVVAINPDNAGEEALVVFSSATINGELVSIRQQKVDIVIGTYSGLQVPISAITMNDEQETGVYILTGNTKRFKKIERIYTGKDYYIVAKGTTKDDLLMDDQIVLHPSGTNNLKVIT